MIPLLAMSYEVGNDVILGALLVGLVIFAGGLLAAMGVIKGWIREVAGVKETTTTELTGQPIQVEMAKAFTTRDSFHKHAELNRQHHEKIEARVAVLERKLEDDKDQIIAAWDDKAMKIHDRINVAIEKIGELRGEVNRIAKA
ncbi:MAG: hypothetical protein ACOYM3_04605 [Terrimicrobiaceae bacterium]